jgi:hypothetical protein
MACFNGASCTATPSSTTSLTHSLHLQNELTFRTTDSTDAHESAANVTVLQSDVLAFGHPTNFRDKQ